MASSKQLQFMPFSSFLDAGFWHKLSENKLNHYGLDESVKEIHGFYFNGDFPGMPCRMNIEYTAFDSEPKIPSRCFKAHGKLYNTNTIDKFKEWDKKELVNSSGLQIWEDIKSGRALEDPSLLSQFLLLTFADLKKYIYYYWFAFPCLCPSQEITIVTGPVQLNQKFTSSQMTQLQTEYDKFQQKNGQYVGYFIIQETKDGLTIEHINKTNSCLQNGSKVVFGFCDPCSVDAYPGWTLRNYLALISYHWGKSLSEVDIVCFRDRSKDGIRDISCSLVLTVKVPSFTDVPKCVGWEKNERSKLGPRMVNLSASMDPTRLAESAVDLNLKLMRWRLLPELNLDKISQTKCLLLGAGTLGCNVARCLMGWGVRHLTLVDNGRVSYSNPVRQSLFVFEDCMNGGRLKAEAAAESLKKIFPGVNATGLNISLPMPGHPVSDGALEMVKSDVQKLDDLVQSHDAIFLLLDTRESRWLPTLMAAAKQKIVICSALGFDTFLVMRHGIKTENSEIPSGASLSSHMIIPGDQLGCYFCNDVVAPGNSTKDRTLDQQCTVSRPGMSYLASALAAELLISVLQHQDGAKAPADTSAKDEHLTQELSCSLGLVPHQIRCFLSRFHQVLPASRMFDKCTACSKTVVDSYKKEGFEFLLKAFNDPGYLENLTGLTQMHMDTLDAEVWDFSDDEECSSMEMS